MKNEMNKSIQIKAVFYVFIFGEILYRSYLISYFSRDLWVLL